MEQDIAPKKMLLPNSLLGKDGLPGRKVWELRGFLCITWRAETLGFQGDEVSGSEKTCGKGQQHILMIHVIADTRLRPVAATYLALGEAQCTSGAEVMSGEMLLRWGSKEVPWIGRCTVLLVLVMARGWNWVVCFAGNRDLNIFWYGMDWGMAFWCFGECFFLTAWSFFMQVKHFLPRNNFEMKSQNTLSI